MKRDFRPAASREEMVYGIRAIQEALRSGKELNKVLIQKNLQGELLRSLKQELRDKSIPWQAVPPERLNSITKANHQGAIAFISPADYMPLETVVQQIFEQGENPLLVVLDRITDVRNFGAIARSAFAAGAHALIIPAYNSVQITSDAIKTSAGALHHIAVCRVNSLDQALQYLRESGIRILAASEKATTLYTEADLSVPLAFVMGSEGEGVEDKLMDYCDQELGIPMAGDIGSLNVSVATGVMLFEAIRQRGLKA